MIGHIFDELGCMGQSEGHMGMPLPTLHAAPIRSPPIRRPHTQAPYAGPIHRPYTQALYAGPMRKRKETLQGNPLQGGRYSVGVWLLLNVVKVL